jgi:hypothetical protein
MITLHKNVRLVLSRFLILFFTISKVSAQDVTLTGNIFEYATYYVNSFDLSTGATNVQIFRYQLTSSDYPVEVKINFRASMISPTLGINSDQTIIEIQTGTFVLSAPLLLDNRDISSETSIIYDQASPPNSIELTGSVIESLDPMQADAILQSVMTTGKIADGEYTFSVQILSTEDQIIASDSKTINIQSPVSITLESPAGSLADTTDNTIYTNFPIFQWFSQPCNGCETFIRIARYNQQQHSSPEDAIEDQRVLPFDQGESWYPINSVNSFQYPLTGAYPLEESNVYCWQIMIRMPTTSGFEEMTSTISAFKIGVSGEINNSSMISNPFLTALKNTIGDDQYNALFGSGNELQGFVPTGQMEINGVSVDESSINYIFNQIQNNSLQIRSVSVE